MSRDGIDLELVDGVLTIQGEKREEKKDEGVQGLRYERRWGSFAANITASHENGILSIRVPKAEEAKGRKIEIGDGDRKQVTEGVRDVS